MGDLELPIIKDSGEVTDGSQKVILMNKNIRHRK